jgi:chromosome segregation ATPase
MNAPITNAHRQLALQIGTTPSCNPIAPDGQEACAQLIANFCAQEFTNLTEQVTGLQGLDRVNEAQIEQLKSQLRVAVVRAEHAEAEWQAQAQLVKDSVQREAATAQQVRQLKDHLEQMLNVAENADKTGYVAGCGFVDLDKLHAKVREAIDATPATASAELAALRGGIERKTAVIKIREAQLGAVTDALANFESRERGIPQAHIAASLVSELRAAIAARQPAPQERSHA